MASLNNLKTGVKLVGGFLAVALMLGVVAVLGYRNIGDMQANQSSLYANEFVPTTQLAIVNAELYRLRGDVYKVVLLPDEYELTVQNAAKSIATIKGEAAKYALLTKDEKKKAALAVFDAALRDYLAQVEWSFSETKAGRSKAVIDATRDGGKTANSRKAVGAAIGTLVSFNVASAEALETASNETARSSARQMATAGFVGFLLAVGLGLVISSSITRPLARGVEMMRELTKGHLGRRLRLGRKDEIGQLTSAMDQFADALQGDVVAALQKIARGDLSVEVHAKDAEDEIAPALKATVTALRGLVGEAAMLSRSAVDGKLATRGDVAKFEGGYREIIQGVNDTLDAIIGPLNMAAEYVDRISKGDIPPAITDTYQGDFNELKNNLNTCIGALGILVDQIGVAITGTREGRLAVRVDAEKSAGVYRKILRGLNDTLDAVIGPLNMAAEYVDRISKGNIPSRVTEEYRGDFNELKNNLNTCIDAIERLVADATSLATSAVEGKLDARADASRHQGDFRKTIQGVNNTLDAVIGPLNMAAEYVDRISKGDIPPRITDEYRGDFNEIKNNLNTCIQAVNLMVADADGLARTAATGRLTVRADAAKHQGDFRKVIDGLNHTLDAVVALIDVMPTPAFIIDREFRIQYANRVISDLTGRPLQALLGTQCRDHLRAADCGTDRCATGQCMARGQMVSGETDVHPQGKALDIAYSGVPIKDETGRVVGAMEVATDLTAVKTAARVAKKQADFQGQEVNKLVVNLERLSLGNLAVDTTVGSSDADTRQVAELFAKVNAGLDGTVRGVRALVQDATALSQAAIEGRLAMRADAAKHQGDFRAIIQGVNDTLDAIIKPLNEAAAVLEKVAKQDLRVQVAGAYVGDHAAMKTSINTMVTGLRENIEQITQNAQALGGSAEELGAISQQMTGNAEETSTQVGVVSAASEQISRNLTVVATSAEEMLASVREIAKSANEAARMAKHAVGVADTTNQTVQKLGDSSTEIGNVIKVITSIAEQTNLLALNATIEAARAGDAGKGFAVVANEVKELAKETAKATEDISGKIAAIQGDTSGAVEAIRQISALISQIDDVSNTIASAVEEQTATTNEIGRNITEAARGSAEIARNIAGVATAADGTTRGAADTQGAARSLATMAGQLQQLVGRFNL
ncbi:MAG TPA: methyl-accepting chemotaxis protein [Vicinamibacterales bacterium]